ncbi:hypothetical protein FKM82_015207 [Ascaphus truei]
MPVSFCYLFLLPMLISRGTSVVVKGHLGHLTNFSLEDVNEIDEEELQSLASQPLPSYMLTLYQRFQRTESMDETESGPGAPSSPQANIIRSLVAKNFDWIGSRCVLVFDFSTLSREEELQFAELRFGLPAFADLFDNELKVAVDIFHQQQSTCQEMNGSCQSYLYLGSFPAIPQSSSSAAWVMLKATEIVQKWFNIVETVNSSAHVQSKQKERSLSADNMQNRHQELNATDHQVLMVIFSNLSKKGKFAGTATLLHVAEHSKYLAKIQPPVTPKNIISIRRHRRSKMFRERLLGVRHVSDGSGSRTLCRKVDFHVDFKQIGWGAWILQPKKFNAYRCEGECPNPVGENFQPTNHAYMQVRNNLSFQY